MKKIFVGNFSFSTTESDLRQWFEPHGAVESVSVVTDRNTGRSRGFAFIEMPNNNSQKSKRISYHHPCHLRAANLEQEPLTLLNRMPGIELIHPELAGRCCGQAGSFGFLHYREGTAIFEEKKAEYRRLGVETITSSCPSCITKIKKEMGESIRVCHPVELLADMIEGDGGERL